MILSNENKGKNKILIAKYFTFITLYNNNKSNDIINNNADIIM